MAVRTFMAEERRAGDRDRDTREEGAVTEGEGTEGEGTEGTGAPRKGSAEESLEDGEKTGEILPNIMKPVVFGAGAQNRRELDLLVVSGSEVGGPAGPQHAATLMSTVARRRATTVLRRWGVAGTAEGEGDHPEEEVLLGGQVRGTEATPVLLQSFILKSKTITLLQVCELLLHRPLLWRVSSCL